MLAALVVPGGLRGGRAVVVPVGAAGPFGVVATASRTADRVC
ncbi:hypothetical protein ABZZ79_18470 [Streptomyces sp. NPDC006458]